ncbi:hypothetical protein ACN47E_007896 [Coniothyrium glycines]
MDSTTPAKRKHSESETVQLTNEAPKGEIFSHLKQMLEQAAHGQQAHDKRVKQIKPQPKPKTAAEMSMQEPVNIDSVLQQQAIMKSSLIRFNDNIALLGPYERVMHVPINTQRVSAFRDHIKLGVYIHWLFVTKDPRGAVNQPFVLKEWVEFLQDYRIPLFPWELDIYKKIVMVLKWIGVELNGPITELIHAKKTALEDARKYNHNSTPLPRSLFNIKNRELANNWLNVYDEAPADNNIIGVVDYLDTVTQQPLPSDGDFRRMVNNVLVPNSVFGRKTRLAEILTASTLMDHSRITKNVASRLRTGYGCAPTVTDQLSDPDDDSMPNEESDNEPERCSDSSRILYNPYNAMRILSGNRVDAIRFKKYLRCIQPLRPSIDLVHRVERSELVRSKRLLTSLLKYEETQEVS